MKKQFNPDDQKIKPHFHPELQPGEVFLTNKQKDGPLSGWCAELKTTRRGTIAYGQNEQIVPEAEPVFAQRSELEAIGVDADDPYGFRRSRIRFEEMAAIRTPDECHGFITQIEWYVREGLPDELADHVEKCPMCAAMLKVSAGCTPEELRALWHSKKPERDAREKFSADWTAWYKTWSGAIYSWIGGPPGSRRAKWLGIPEWEDYRP